MIHTEASILEKMKDGPVTVDQLRNPAWSERKNRGFLPILNDMKARGLVRMRRFEGMTYWTLADWAPSTDQVLKNLENRSRRTIDGCLLWAEVVDPHVGPTARFDKPRAESILRKVWRLKKGPLGYSDVVRMHCGDERCIELAHMYKGSRGDTMIGRKKQPMHAMRIAEVVRSRVGKLSMDKAREIRMSEESSDALAVLYGVSADTIRATRRGATWRETAPAGMFSALIQQEKRAA